MDGGVMKAIMMNWWQWLLDPRIKDRLFDSPTTNRRQPWVLGFHVTVTSCVLGIINWLLLPCFSCKYTLTFRFLKGYKVRTTKDNWASQISVPWNKSIFSWCSRRQNREMPLVSQLVFWVWEARVMDILCFFFGLATLSRPRPNCSCDEQTPGKEFPANTSQLIHRLYQVQWPHEIVCTRQELNLESWTETHC